MKFATKRILQWLFILIYILFICWLAKPLYQLGFIKFQGNLTVNAITKWILIYGLLFFFIIVWITKTGQTTQKKQFSPDKSFHLERIILFCALTGLISISVVNFCIDPWDMYGMKLFPSRVNPSRALKLDYYSQLSESPEMIITGTSAAFMISPSYIQEELGISAFNWSLDGSEAPEIRILLEYIDQHNKNFPHIILMQVSERFSKSDYNRMPLQFLQYLDFCPLVQETNSRLSDLINLSQLSDSLYVYRYATSRDEMNLSGYRFQSDGFGDQAESGLSEVSILRQTKKIPNCTSIPDTVRKNIEDIIEYNGMHNSSVIFYISPSLPAFYDTFLESNAEYHYCHQVVTDYFHDLASQHENVFFEDYILLERINGLDGEEGFYDAAHLTPQNSELLIYALSDTIHQAYETAEAQRKAAIGESE